METNVKRIAVLTSGGDAPGLNAVIRSVVKTAVVRYGWEVLGIRDGFEGLIGDARVQRLGLADVSGLLPRGGSLLGCANRGHLRGAAAGVENANQDVLREVAATVGKLGVDGLIIAGGDGSHRIAAQLCRWGVPLVCVPKTIDNDLRGTDTAFGFDSAVTFATDAIDRLHSTAESHGRILVVEVMGHKAGWIALHAGIAGGADVILIPEIPYDLARAAAHIAHRASTGKQFSIVVAAEGAVPAAAAGDGRAGGIRARTGIANRVARNCRRSPGMKRARSCSDTCSGEGPRAPPTACWPRRLGRRRFRLSRRVNSATLLRCEPGALSPSRLQRRPVVRG